MWDESVLTLGVYVHRCDRLQGDQLGRPGRHLQEGRRPGLPDRRVRPLRQPGAPRFPGRTAFLWMCVRHHCCMHKHIMNGSWIKLWVQRISRGLVADASFASPIRTCDTEPVELHERGSVHVCPALVSLPPASCAQPRLACRPPSTPTATRASTSTPSTSCCPARAPRTTPRAPAASKRVHPPTLHMHRCEGWCMLHQHRAAVCGARGWRVGQARLEGLVLAGGCPVPHPGSNKFWQQCLRARLSALSPGLSDARSLNEVDR